MRACVRACVHVCRLAISEPSAGSDVARIRTTAVRTADGGWRIDGVKKWITAVRAPVLLLPPPPPPPHCSTSGPSVCGIVLVSGGKAWPWPGGRG
eukprot:COSAG01_NODE_3457_length_6072_cov_14.110330_9_plen_95_part_00